MPVYFTLNSIFYNVLSWVNNEQTFLYKKAKMCCFRINYTYDINDQYFFHKT